MNLELCYINLVCYPDVIYIYFRKAKLAQIHLDLF